MPETFQNLLNTFQEDDVAYVINSQKSILKEMFVTSQYQKMVESFEHLISNCGDPHRT